MKIHFMGDWQTARNRPGPNTQRVLLVGDCPVGLRPKSFKYLLALAVSRKRTTDGWIVKTEIEPGENHARYIYQLKAELEADGHLDVKALAKRIQNYNDVRQMTSSNPADQCYRLNVDARDITFDEMLLTDDDLRCADGY